VAISTRSRPRPSRPASTPANDDRQGRLPRSADPVTAWQECAPNSPRAPGHRPEDLRLSGLPCRHRLHRNRSAHHHGARSAALKCHEWEAEAEIAARDATVALQPPPQAQISRSERRSRRHARSARGRPSGRLRQARRSAHHLRPPSLGRARRPGWVLPQATFRRRHRAGATRRTRSHHRCRFAAG
jgi:hypothetical protein